MTENEKPKQREIGCKWTRQEANIFSNIEFIRFQRASGEDYWRFLGYYYYLSTQSVYYHGHLKQVLETEREELSSLLADYLGIDGTQAEDFLRALVSSGLAIIVSSAQPFEKYVDEKGIIRDGVPIPEPEGDSIVFPLIARAQGSYTESKRVQGIQKNRKPKAQEKPKAVQVPKAQEKVQSPGFKLENTEQWNLPTFPNKSKSKKSTFDILEERGIKGRYNDLVQEFTKPTLENYCRELDKQSKDIKGDRAVGFLRKLEEKAHGF